MLQNGNVPWDSYLALKLLPSLPKLTVAVSLDKRWTATVSHSSSASGSPVHAQYHTPSSLIFLIWGEGIKLLLQIHTAFQLIQICLLHW